MPFILLIALFPSVPAAPEYCLEREVPVGLAQGAGVKKSLRAVDVLWGSSSVIMKGCAPCKRGSSAFSQQAPWNANTPCHDERPCPMQKEDLLILVLQHTVPGRNNLGTWKAIAPVREYLLPQKQLCCSQAATKDVPSLLPIFLWFRHKEEFKWRCTALSRRNSADNGYMEGPEVCGMTTGRGAGPARAAAAGLLPSGQMEGPQ